MVEFDKEEKEAIKFDVEEMIKKLQLEKVPDCGCHLDFWIIGDLRRNYTTGRWEEAGKLIKLCRIALLKKDWKPVKDFLHDDYYKQFPNS